MMLLSKEVMTPRTEGGDRDPSLAGHLVAQGSAAAAHRKRASRRDRRRPGPRAGGYWHPRICHVCAGMVPRTEEIVIDSSVLLFTFAVSMATGILFGLAPTLQARRLNLVDALKEAGVRSGGAFRRGFRHRVRAAPRGRARRRARGSGDSRPCVGPRGSSPARRRRGTCLRSRSDARGHLWLAA